MLSINFISCRFRACTFPISIHLMLSINWFFCQSLELKRMISIHLMLSINVGIGKLQQVLETHFNTSNVINQRCRLRIKPIPHIISIHLMLSINQYKIHILNIHPINILPILWDFLIFYQLFLFFSFLCFFKLFYFRW